MVKKEIYEKPVAVNLMDNSVIYGQQVQPLGECVDGVSASGLVGCQTGLTVTTGQCLAGEYPTVASSCETGSTHKDPGDHCYAGGSVN